MLGEVWHSLDLCAKKVVEKGKKVTVIKSKPKNLGRAYLVGKLRKRGWSRRDSVRILNRVINAITQALRRGEEVEFPFGALRRVRHQHAKTRGWFLDKITSTYKKLNTVKLVLNEKGHKLLNEKK
jgi:hypothetical protein